jgi:hypothetical protein
MFDLEEGVAELFDEAAQKGRRYFNDPESGTSRSNWLAKAVSNQAYEEYVTREIREIRDRRPPYVIQPLETQIVVCPVCGRQGEIREGVARRIMHPGWRGISCFVEKLRPRLSSIDNPWLRGYFVANDNRQPPRRQANGSQTVREMRPTSEGERAPQANAEGGPEASGAR